MLLTRAIRVRDTRRESRHHADYYAALVEAIGLPRPALDLRVLLPQGARDEAVALLRAGGWDGTAPVLACAPGAAYGAAKQWPARHVAVVASAWIAKGGLVVLVGAGADRSAAEAVLAGVPASSPAAICAA
jgi:heptosyltransferase-2